MNDSEKNFILQQGLGEPQLQATHHRFSALLFQPRIVGLVVLIGLFSQSAAVFLALSAVLWWSALLPSFNPFDALYNLLFSSRPGHVHLEPAPAPRRFAQGMAGTFALAIGVLLRMSWFTAAYILEVFLAAAILLLVIGRFCLGSFIYHLLRGNVAFARKTLPWARHRVMSR
jgi:hypothetical protein